jgi:hypothetical protein
MFNDTLIQTDSFHGQGVHPLSGQIIDIADFVGSFETVVLDDDETTVSWGTVVVNRKNPKVREYIIGTFCQS